MTNSVLLSVFSTKVCFYCNGSVFGIIVLQENEAIAVKCFPDDIIWGIKKFGSALVCLKFSFDKIPQHLLLKYSPKPGQRLHRVLYDAHTHGY